MAAAPSSPARDGAPSSRLVAERAYVELRDRIVTLRLAPGTVLREDELMRELAIGRTPLREAVKRLALENLVVGAAAARHLRVRRGGRRHREHHRGARRARGLRRRARRAAHGRRRRAIAAEALLREVEELSRPDDPDWLMRFDERIHRFTWEASGNPYLTETLERYFTHSLRIWYLVLDRLPGLGHAVHDQAHLLEALLAEDGARARAIMREHVLDFQREILAAFSR